MPKDSSVRLWLSLGGAVLCAPLLVVALSLGDQDSQDISVATDKIFSRLRPTYYFGPVRIRGRTFNRHQELPVDLRLKDAIRRRVRGATSVNKPHLVARRQTIIEPVSEVPQLYKAMGGSSTKGLPSDCRKCTIVGNAGTLKGSGLGWLIDTSECVFRLGLAPTAGHEEDVGVKTTVRVLAGDSFGDLLRRPHRLSTGSLKADTWLLFNPHNVDALKVRLKLRVLPRDSNLTVLTLTQAGESDAKRTFKVEANRIGYKLAGSAPSTLWYAVQASRQAGCVTTQVIGVPGPKYCKKHANSHHGQIASRYWGAFPPPLCSGRGKDWGAGPDSSPEQSLTLSDRRAIKGLATQESAGIIFTAPTWHLLDS